MLKVCRNYIDGKWVESSSQRRETIANPANVREELAVLPLSTRAEAQTAIDAAAAALPAWRETPGPQRARILLKARSLFQDRREEIARGIVQEEGKVWAEAVASAQRGIDALEYAAGAARRLMGETRPSGFPGVMAMTVRQPLGVVGLITPWNFPFAIPVWKLAPALAAGCTAVMKPSPLVPLAAILLHEVLHEAGLPPGVANLVHGDREVGEELCEHPKVAGVSFTGSTPVGQAIYAQAAAHGKKVQCQMGAKNAFVVMADADLDAALRGVISSGFGSSGQRCMATSRVVVQESVADGFVARLVDAGRSVKAGSGMDPDVLVGPMVSAAHKSRVLSLIQAGIDEGARLVLGGHAMDAPPYDAGWFVQPTVFDHVQPSMRIAQEEIFGPVLSVFRARDLSHALEIVNSSPFGMASTIFTDSINTGLQFAESVDTGLVTVNVPMLPPQTQFPFGGIKESGRGARDQGDTAIDFYTEIKVISVRYRPHSQESTGWKV